MKTFTKILTKVTSVAAVMGIIASMGIANCMAADTTSIGITNAVTNSVIQGDANIINSTFAAGVNVTEQVTNVMQGVAVGGDINLVDVSTLLGENVVKTGVTALDSVIAGGDLTITNIADILGKNVGVGFTTGINNAIVVGDTDITNLINTFGSAENLQAVLQNVASNSILGGDYNNINLVQ